MTHGWLYLELQLRGGESEMAEKPEDLSLPASVVARIIKDALPEGVSVSKEARVAIGKAASVFILYCTACSNNFALQAKRKTLAASDVLSALNDMEFDQFVPELKTFLEAYKQDQKGKRVAAADRRKQKAVAAQTAASEALAASSSLSSAPQPATSGSTEGVITANVSKDSVSTAGNSSGVDGVEGSVVREEEAMETDTVEHGGGAGITSDPLSSTS